MSNPRDEAKSSAKATSAQGQTKGKASGKLFVEFDPKASGTRRDVRRAAARASANTRRATIHAKMLAQREARSQCPAKMEPEQRSLEGQVSWEATTRRTVPIVLRSELTRSTDVACRTEQQSTCALLWNCSLGYNIDRRYLCSSVFHTKALYMSLTLVLVTWKLCPTGTGMQGPLRGGILWVREETIRALKAMVTSPDSDRVPVCLASAVAVLASWELVSSSFCLLLRYGDQGTFEVHAQAWRSLMTMAGHKLDGLDIRNHVNSLADRLLDSLRCHCARLRYPTDSLFTCRSTQKAVGFSVIQLYNIEDSGGLFNAADQLAQFQVYAPEALPRLREIGCHLLMWSVPTSVTDQALQTAMVHTSSALKAITHRIYSHPNIAPRIGTDWDRQTAEEMTYKSLLMMGTQPFGCMIGTPLEELTFWALFSICASTNSWNLDILEILGRNLKSLGACTFDEVKVILQRFVYHEEVCYESARALYAAVMSLETDTVPRSSRCASSVSNGH